MADGGTISHGISILLILQAHMKHLQDQANLQDAQIAKPCEVFDLIGGTGVGGCVSSTVPVCLELISFLRIIAVLLGRLEMDIQTAIDRYTSIVDQVFPHQKWYEFAGLEKPTKILEEELKKIVKEMLRDTDTLLLGEQESQCKMSVLHSAFSCTSL